MSFREISDMVHDRSPVTIQQTATVRLACRRMRDQGVGAVLVIDRRHRLVGIFTGRDAVTRVLAEGREGAQTRLAEVMTPAPKTLPPGKSAIEALRLMRDSGFRHIQIVDEGGRLVGVVSSGDFRGLEQAQIDEETGLFERIR